MFPVLYILAMSAVFVAVDRYAPVPKPVVRDSVSAMFVLGCYLFGGAIGWVLPEVLAQETGVTWSDGALTRGAQVFGTLAGFMIAARGAVVWAALFVLTVAGYLLTLLVGYIFGTHIS